MGGNAGGAAGVPSRSGGGEDLNSTLAAMADMTQKNTVAINALLQSFDRMSRHAKDTTKELGNSGHEFKFMLDSATNVEHAMTRINQLMKSRISGGATKQGTVAYLKNLQSEYKILLDTMNQTKGQGRYTKEIQKSIEGVTKALKIAQNQSEDTWDADRIREMNKELKTSAERVEHLKKAMGEIQVEKLSKGFSRVGRSIDEAFGHRITDLIHRTAGLNGLFKVITNKKHVDNARENIGKAQSVRNQTLSSQRNLEAAQVHETYGRRGVKILRGLGYAEKIAGERNFGGEGVRARKSIPVASRGGAAPVVPSAVSGGSKLLALTGGGAEAAKRSGLVGLDGQPLSYKPPPPPSLPPKDLGAGMKGLHAQQGVGAGDVMSIAKSFGKGGMGEGLLGMASGGASKGLGLLSKTTPLLAIGTALVQLRDKVAKDNQDIRDSMAGSGLMAGSGQGPAAAYKNARETLMTTGLSNAAMLGVTHETNNKLMQTLGEQGIGVGGTMAQRQGTKGSVNLGDSLQERGTLTGEGFYGAMMKNTVFGGSALGMNQDSSARLTLKLMEKFGQTTSATQKFFVGLDDMMASSGVSASKYVEVIDSVTDHFDVMNKSLGQTLTILSTLGKTGRMTGEQMKDVVTQATKPNQMNTAQRAYALMNMDPEIKEKVAKQEDKNISQRTQDLQKMLDSGRAGVTLASDMSNQTEAEAALRKAGADTQTMQAFVDSLEKAKNANIAGRARIGALRGDDKVAGAMTMEAVGGSAASEMGIKLGHIQNLLKQANQSEGLGIDANKLFAGDSAEIGKILRSKVANSLVREGTFSGGEDILKTLNSFGQINRSGAENIVGMGTENLDGVSPEERKALLEQALGNQGVADERVKNIEAQQAQKKKAMVKAQRLREAANPKLGKSKDDAEALSKFQNAARTNPTGLKDELRNNTGFQNMATDSASELAQGTQEINDTLSAMMTEDKAKSSASQTRTTADIFANAFEHLFTRLTNLLDPLLQIMQWSPWAKDKGAALAAIKEDKEARGVRRENLTQAGSEFDTLLQGLKGKGPKERKELEDELKAYKEDAKKLTPESNYEQLQAVENKARALRGKLGGGATALTESDQAYNEAQNARMNDRTNATRGFGKDMPSEGMELRSVLMGTGDMSGDLKSMAARQTSLKDYFKDRNFTDIQETWKNGGKDLDAITAQMGTEAQKRLDAALQNDPAFRRSESTDSAGNVTHIHYSASSINQAPSGDASVKTTPAKVGA